MDELITSRKNALAQQARSVRDGRERESVFVEGLRLCEEALRAGVAFDFVLHTRPLEENARGSRLLAELREVCPRVVAVSEAVPESVSDTKTPQGAVAVVRRPKYGPEALDRKSTRLNPSHANISYAVFSLKK